VSLKTIAGWAVIVLLIWWAAEQPDAAAHVAQNVGHALAAGAAGISSFFRKA